MSTFVLKRTEDEKWECSIDEVTVLDADPLAAVSQALLTAGVRGCSCQDCVWSTLQGFVGRSRT